MIIKNLIGHRRTQRLDTDRHRLYDKTINNDTERMTMYKNKKGGFDTGAFIWVIGVLALCFFLS